MSFCFWLFYIILATLASLVSWLQWLVLSMSVCQWQQVWHQTSAHHLLLSSCSILLSEVSDLSDNIPHQIPSISLHQCCLTPQSPLLQTLCNYWVDCGAGQQWAVTWYQQTMIMCDNAETVTWLLTLSVVMTLDLVSSTVLSVSVSPEWKQWPDIVGVSGTVSETVLVWVWTLDSAHHCSSDLRLQSTVVTAPPHPQGPDCDDQSECDNDVSS